MEQQRFETGISNPCPICGEEIIQSGKGRKRKYCSEKCSQKSKLAKWTEERIIECPSCKVMFDRYPNNHQGRPRSFCSDSCVGYYRKGTYKKIKRNEDGKIFSDCKHCGTEFMNTDFNSPGNNSLSSFCSRNCTRKYRYLTNPEAREREKKRGIKARTSLRGRAVVMHNHARARAAEARDRGREMVYDLEVEWIEEKLKEGKCELTDIEFQITVGDNPYAPSLDRIDSSKGYTKDNVQVVVVAINMMRNRWDDDTIKNVMLHYLKKNEFWALKAPNLHMSSSEK